MPRIYESSGKDPEALALTWLSDAQVVARLGEYPQGIFDLVKDMVYKGAHNEGHLRTIAEMQLLREDYNESAFRGAETNESTGRFDIIGFQLATVALMADMYTKDL